jgi:hypothetical protein
MKLIALPLVSSITTNLSCVNRGQARSDKHVQILTHVVAEAHMMIERPDTSTTQHPQMQHDS